MKINKILIFSYILIIILILLILYQFYLLLKKYNNKNIEKFKNNKIIFLDYNTVKNFLINDNDNYVKNFTKKDLKARNVNSINDYIINSSKCIKNFSNNEKQIIYKGCIEADKFLKNYNNILDGNEISKLKWKFALTYYNNYEYEEGFPHTREDIIFLSEKLIPKELNENFINTLIHEKIHIYQRYNNSKIEKIINKLGFYKYDIIKDNNRANPDLNNYLYKNKNNDILQCVYNNNPISISDVNCLNNNNIYEHPYEYIAYKIANEYNKSLVNKYINL
jgi:hypothetical protein|tara:strand:+ start:2671 stop:3504 length:834 start_codon:yes stop_codon:yes gene_type:complete